MRLTKRAISASGAPGDARWERCIRRAAAPRLSRSGRSSDTGRPRPRSSAPSPVALRPACSHRAAEDRSAAAREACLRAQWLLPEALKAYGPAVQLLKIVGRLTGRVSRRLANGAA